MIIFQSLIYYIIGYFIVTTIATLHFLFNWKIRGQEAFDTTKGIQALKANATEFDAFKNTKPFHPMYNIIVFPIISFFMINDMNIVISINQVILISVLWVIYSLILDCTLWVILPHPWRLTKEMFFVGYQPWITLAYVAIFISPIISHLYLIIY